MISKMIRYDLVLYAGQQEHFIEKLRELGLVDITTSGWEPSDGDRALLTDIDSHNKAIDFLSSFKKSEEYNVGAELYASGKEAYEAYVEAREERTRIQQEVARLEKLADEVAPWGRFSAEDIARLTERGVTLRYFTAQPAAYEKFMAECDANLTVAEIGRTQSVVYFVVVATDNTPVVVDGQEVRLPAMDSKAIREEIARLEAENKALNATFSRAAASCELIAEQCGALKERLQGLKVGASAQREADGELLVMEGWAEADTAERVDKLLEE